MNPDSTMGTVVSEKSLERITAAVQKTKGEILTGGSRMTGKSPLDGYDLSKGAFFPPTVVTDIDTQDELWQEEVFGPVVVIKRFSVSRCISLCNYVVTH